MWQTFLRPLPLVALILVAALMLLKLFTYGCIAAVGWLFVVGLESMRADRPTDNDQRPSGGTL